MNKFKFYFILLITTVILFSCSKNDNNYTVEPPRDYQTQYNAEIKTIETYLTNNYFEVTNKPGQTTDQDVVIKPITDATIQKSILSYLNAPTYPKLLSKIVKQDGIEYTLYYLVLRPGIGDSPCSVDGVFASYRGTYLSESTSTTPSTISATQFEEVVYPSDFLSLFTTISGWGETFPLFKKGTYTSNSNGSVTYNDFGAGVMFLPSGLAYYNTGSYAIPAYSPLVFSFKLYEIKRLDQDNDGIPSYLEDLNHDGFVRFLPSTDADRYADDTDQDGVPNFYDVDDDGDKYTTRYEITKPDGSNLLLDGPSLYYPFDPIVSDPVKVTDEKRGVPAFSAAGNPDYTSPSRLRIYLDPDHHTAK